MTTFNADHNNNELLDLELTEEELTMISAGIVGGWKTALFWFGSSEYRQGVIDQAHRINNPVTQNVGLWQ